MPVMDCEDAVRKGVNRSLDRTERLVDVLMRLCEWDARVFQSGDPVWQEARALLDECQNSSQRPQEALETRRT